MDKETRNWLEVIMSQVEALGVRVRKLEEAAPPVSELLVKVVHTRDEAGGTP